MLTFNVTDGTYNNIIIQVKFIGNTLTVSSFTIPPPVFWSSMYILWCSNYTFNSDSAGILQLQVTSSTTNAIVGNNT